ncbi:hypothetical protein ACO22_01734 [Paracoccidioides brasiliensis]|uniref:Uncharacterized protein n=1 Tax=Paracoccidioides brasiliensis TaxID=121759 RepID=A0A1D2JKP4_PARBR|nr:hypothetical protein ACO22_01734 [Paracoccidioides brasiliensis]
MPSEAQESGPPLHWLRPLHPTTKCPRFHLPPQSRPHRHIRLRRQLPRLPREKWRADPRSRAGGLRPRRHVATGPGRRATPAEAARHGSVYRNAEAERVLASLDEGEGLEGQVATALSHPFSPNWQDASTQRECDEFDEVLGGSGELTEVTGSKAHHIALKILLFGEIISLLDTILVQQYLLLVRATDSLPTAGGGHHLFLNLEWFLSLHWFSSGEISLSPCHEGSR